MKRVLYIWVDDVRPMPDSYSVHIHSVWDFICTECSLNHNDNIIISLDHDAGDYDDMGGDYIEILRYLERMVDSDWIRNNWTFRIHTANPPGRQLMLNIIERNSWNYENEI